MNDQVNAPQLTEDKRQAIKDMLQLIGDVERGLQQMSTLWIDKFEGDEPFLAAYYPVEFFPSFDELAAEFSEWEDSVTTAGNDLLNN